MMPILILGIVRISNVIISVRVEVNIIIVTTTFSLFLDIIIPIAILLL